VQLRLPHEPFVLLMQSLALSLQNADLHEEVPTLSIVQKFSGGFVVSK
jgi:hypothetical protein